MITLRALGRIGFEGIEESAGRALLAQPKRVAVLAYLLLARGGRTRAHLIAEFWPEATRSRGRGSLRNAVHFLRRHLGPGAIDSVGETLIADARRIRCDALDLEACIESGRLGEALDLYRGDLLPGLEVADAPAFESWLAGERERLRRLAAGAAWKLADLEESRGNRISASDHGRAATRLSGGDEVAVRRLVALLERAGDRVAAARELESYTRRWAAERGVPPSQETQRLAARLRTAVRPERAGSRAPAPRLLAPGTRRIGRIAVLPLLDRGTENPHFAPGLTHEIVSALVRLSAVRVIGRDSIERAQARSAERSELRDVLDADWILDGSLRSSGGSLLLHARLRDAETGRTLWADILEGAPAQALDLRARLIAGMADALGLLLPDEESNRLARQPTNDPEAYAAYLEGRAHWSRRSAGDLQRAVACFERALGLDPEFALAHAGLADASLTLPVGGARMREARVRARAAVQDALRLDPELGEAHATLGLLRTFHEYDWPGAEAAFRRAVALSPGHASAHHWLGSFLSFVARQFEEGAAELEIARELDPLAPAIISDCAMALLHRRRGSEALDAYRAALRTDPTTWRLHYDMGVASMVAGDPDEGAAHLDRAWQLGAWGAPVGRRTTEESMHWRRILERRIEELAARRLNRGMREFEMAMLSSLLGRAADALRWLEAARAAGSWIFTLQYFPAFENLLEHKQFRDQLRAMGAPHLRDG